MPQRPMQSFAAALALTLAAGPVAGDDAVIVSHGISAFGDLKYPPGFPHFDYVNPDAPQGGTMSFRGQLASNTFDSLNHFILDGERAQGLLRIHNTLMARAFDEPDAVYGLIAESIEYPEDRSWVVYNMRPEARFSDDTPITAEDVAFTIEILGEEGAPFYRLAVADVLSTDILGPHRVRVNFRDGVPTRDLAADIGLLPILPKHYYEEVPFGRSTMDPPVSSGEFRVDAADPGRSITYCRAEDYWGADLPVNVGRDNFDCFRYEYFADRVASFEALKAGEYLFHEELFSAIWATGYDFPALENGWVIREEISDGRSSGAQGFYFNLRRPQFQDIRVREAIAMMFNFEWSNETLFYGLYNRTDSFWENSVLQAEGLPEGAELAILEEFRDQLPPEVFTEPPVSPPVASTRQLDRGLLRAASDLLDEAGWEVGDDGVRRNAEGEVLRIEFVDDSPAFERIILPYVENLRRLGVDAEHVLIDPAQMQQRQQEFDYDITPGRIVIPLTLTPGVRNVFGSQSADAPGALNLAGVSDPVVDALINRALSAENREDMSSAVRAIDRVLRAQHIWAPNWHKGTHWIAYWDVFGRPDTKPPFVRGDDYWWWDQEKYDALREAGALR